MAFGERVLSTTQDKLIATLFDGKLGSAVLASRMLRSAKKFKGEQLKAPFKHAKSTNGGAFSGFDTFDTSAVDNRIRLAFDSKNYRQTVALPFDELWANEGEEKIMDLESLQMNSDLDDMFDDIAGLFYSGDNSNTKEFQGLEGIVDDGSNQAVYGGQTRSTFTSLNSTVTASGGTLSLTNMATLFSAVTSGSQKVTLCPTTETIFDLYESLLNPQQRIMKDVSMAKGLKGGAGFVGMDFRGAPVIADEKCTADVFYALNENYLDWYARPMRKTKTIPMRSQDIKGNDLSPVIGMGFTWSGWIIPSNAAAEVGHFYLSGELISFNPRRHGKSTGINSV